MASSGRASVNADLLSKMTGAEAVEPLQFNEEQARMMIAAVLPRFFNYGPMAGMGLTITINEDDRGWDIRVDKPAE